MHMVSFENVKVSFNLLLNQTFFDHVIIEEHLFRLQVIFNAFKTALRENSFIDYQ